MRTFILLVVLVIGATAADPGDQSLVSAARAAAEHMPAGGIVVAVSTAGVRQTWAFGHAHTDASLAPERIRFEIGSISKLFNAVVLARAVRRGQAHFDDSIKHWLPPLPPTPIADPKVASITLLQLATHRSGLPRMPANLPLLNLDDPFVSYDAQALVAAVAAEKLEHAPPAGVSYSNYGAGLLGYLLAQRRGLSWPALLAAEVTGPAKLVDTVAQPDARLDAHLTQPHAGAQAVPAWRFAALAAAGSVRSSAADLLTFGEDLLGADPELAADWAVLVAHTDDESGPGIFRDTDADPPAYWHNGATHGSCSFIRLDPTQRRVEVVLTNQAECDPQTTISAAHPPLRAPAITPAAGWERELPGVYRYEDGPELTLKAEAGALRAQLTGQSFLTLVCTGPNVWRWQEVAARLAIERDAAGKVVAIVLHQNGQVLRFARRP